MSHSQSRQRVILGAFIIAFGVFALLNKLDIFNIGNLFQFWPTVFILVGFLKIADSKNRSSLMIGAIFIVVGALMMLNNLGVIHFSWSNWWPLIVIGVGISLIVKDHSKTESSSQTFLSGEKAANDNEVLNITAVMGGNKTLNSAQSFKGGDLTAIMGGVDLDLRSASIEGEATLNLWAAWGGIVIRVPSDWIIVNRCTALLGGVDDKSFSSPASNKRLVITGTVIMGGIEIKN